MRLAAATPLVLVLVLASAASAQQHEADPAAAEAFEAVIDAYRSRPGLEVRTEVSVMVEQGGVRSTPQTSEAEFVIAPGRGVVHLNGFTVHIGTGELFAVHESTDGMYFSMSDDGSPYYALMNCFMDIPFPHLALAFGEPEPEFVWMQLHQKAPWVVPTGVETVDRDGRSLQRIMMTSDHEQMEILVDPETKLIESLELVISAGPMVQEGSSVTYVHSFEYVVHDDPLGDDLLAFDPGDRQRVDLVASLVERPEPAQRPGAQGRPRLVGQEAPPFVLQTLDGDVVDSSDLRGHVVVLDFWATWCGPCKRALPLLHGIGDWVDEELLPVRVLTVNVWEIPEGPGNTPEARTDAARGFWEENDYRLPVLMDFSDETAGAYQVSGIPTTVVIRADGIISAMHSGVGEDYDTQLRAEIMAAIEAVEID